MIASPYACGFGLRLGRPNLWSEPDGMLCSDRVDIELDGVVSMNTSRNIQYLIFDIREDVSVTI
ncbi:MAG: hypothetical protein HY243_06940 [Proteobacteria bacterium]|nr:hypothetical protein [Pseudomonadota bacterium]